MNSRIERFVFPGWTILIESAYPWSRGRSLSKSSKPAPVYVGLWLPVGSRFERHKEHGLCHFLEHFVFKNPHALRWSQELERRGGEVNAVTAHEYTCFYFSCLNEDVKLGFSCLASLLAPLRFDKKHFKNEKQVIAQEILSVQDDIEEEFHNFILENLGLDTGLEHKISGEVSDVRALSFQQLKAWHEQYYRRGKKVLSVSGAIGAQEVLSLFARYFLRSAPHFQVKSKRSRAFDVKKDSSHPHYGKLPWNQPRLQTNRVFTRDRHTQHLYLGILFPLPGMFDRRRFAVNVIHQWLASGIASHLYRLIREELGLVYYIGGHLASFTDMGFYLIEASAEPKLMPEVLDRVLGELKKLSRKSWSPQWLQRYRQMILKQLWMSEHEGEGRMQSLGMNELFWGRPWRIEEYARFYEELTVTDIREAVKHNLCLSQARIYLYGQNGSLFGPYVKGLLPSSSAE